MNHTSKGYFVVLFVLGSILSCKQSPVVKLHDLKDEMCECEDSVCVGEVYSKLKELEEPENSMASRREIIAVMTMLAECAEKIGVPQQTQAK